MMRRRHLTEVPLQADTVATVLVHIPDGFSLRDFCQHLQSAPHQFQLRVQIDSSLASFANQLRSMIDVPDDENLRAQFLTLSIRGRRYAEDEMFLLSLRDVLRPQGVTPVFLHFELPPQAEQPLLSPAAAEGVAPVEPTPVPRGLDRLVDMGFAPREVDRFRELLTRSAEMAGHSHQQAALEESFLADVEVPSEPVDEQVAYRNRRRVERAARTRISFWSGLPDSRVAGRWFGDSNQAPSVGPLSTVGDLILALVGLIFGPLVFYCAAAGAWPKGKMVGVFLGAIANVLIATMFMAKEEAIADLS